MKWPWRKPRPCQHLSQLHVAWMEDGRVVCRCLDCGQLLEPREAP